MDKWEIERQEEQKKVQELNKKFQEVLKLLFMTPDKIDPEYSDARVTGQTKTGESITLRSSRYEKWRIDVYGNYPKGLNGEYVNVYEFCKKTRTDGSEYDSNDEVRDPDVHISSNKIASVIAKDITQRFMPGYLKRLELVKQRIAESQKYENVTIETMAFVAGRSLFAEEVKSKELDYYHTSGHLGEMKFSGTRVDMEVSDLTRTQAKAILEIINKVKIIR